MRHFIAECRAGLHFKKELHLAQVYTLRMHCVVLACFSIWLWKPADNRANDDTLLHNTTALKASEFNTGLRTLSITFHRTVSLYLNMSYASLSNIREKTVASLYLSFERNSRPTIQPTMTICILKLKILPESPPPLAKGRVCLIVSFADGLNLPLV